VPVRKAAAVTPARAPVVRVQDITVPPEYNLETVGITQSLLAKWGCRQKFLFAINRWTPNERNKNVEFGNMVHHVLDLAYTAKRMPSAKAIDKWVDAYLADWETRNMGAALEDMERHAAVTVVLMAEYLKHYLADFDGKKFTGVEALFSVAWKGFLLRGKKDGRYLTKALKKWIMEHKTKKEISEDDIADLLTFDLQSLFYITAEEAEDPANPVHGVLYNVVRNPGHKLKAGESLPTYAERVRKEAAKRPGHFFVRFESTYTKENKRIFAQQLEAKLKEIRAFLRGELACYRNEAMCKTGHIKCEYLKACSSGTMAGYRQKARLFEELDEL
jgi:hypothetical protein